MLDQDYERLTALLGQARHGHLTPAEEQQLRRFVARWDLRAYRYPLDAVVRMGMVALGMERFLRLKQAFETEHGQAAAAAI